MGRPWIEYWKQKPLLHWLWWSIGFFAATVLVVGFLGGDRDYISFRAGVTVAVIAAIPLIGVTALMYIIADRETRRAYNLRLLLVALLIVIKYTWEYVS